MKIHSWNWDLKLLIRNLSSTLKKLDFLTPVSETMKISLCFCSFYFMIGFLWSFFGVSLTWWEVNPKGRKFKNYNQCEFDFGLFTNLQRIIVAFEFSRVYSSSLDKISRNLETIWTKLLENLLLENISYQSLRF